MPYRENQLTNEQAFLLAKLEIRKQDERARMEILEREETKRRVAQTAHEGAGGAIRLTMGVAVAAAMLIVVGFVTSRLTEHLWPGTSNCPTPASSP